MMKLLTPLAAMTLAAFGAPVLAQDSLSAAQVKIRYDKSDLASERGRRAIDQKISFAVNRVCGDQVLGTKEEVDMIRDCKVSARGMARAQLPMTMADNR